MSISLPKKYNIEKLNFNSIKNELSTIPKIIRKKSNIGIRSSTSLNHSNNNDSYSNDPKVLSLTPSITHKKRQSSDGINLFGLHNNKINDGSLFQVPEKNSNNITIIRSKTSSNFDENILKNINGNYRNKINEIENEHRKVIELLQKENKEYIEKISENYEQKIKELTLFYESKIFTYEKKIMSEINHLKDISVNYISLDQHNNIITNLNVKWSEKFNEAKKEYEAYIERLTNILTYKEKYRGLLSRMYFYKAKEIDISKIEEALKDESLPNRPKKKNNMFYLEDLTRISELSEEINYSSALFELKMLYNKKMNELVIKNNNQIDNLSKNVIKILDSLLNNNYNNNIELNIDDNVNKSQSNKSNDKENSNNEYSNMTLKNEKEEQETEKKQDLLINQLTSKKTLKNLTHSDRYDDSFNDQVTNKDPMNELNNINESLHESVGKSIEKSSIDFEVSLIIIYFSVECKS